MHRHDSGKNHARRRGPILALGLTLVLVSLLFAACGGSSSETPYPLEPRPKRMGVGGSRA